MNYFSLTALTETPKKCILNSPIPRLCNGSTSDSGSDCGGSNPPWGTKAEHFFCSAFFVSFSDFSVLYKLTFRIKFCVLEGYSLFLNCHSAVSAWHYIL